MQHDTIANLPYHERTSSRHMLYPKVHFYSNDGLWLFEALERYQKYNILTAFATWIILAIWYQIITYLRMLNILE